VRAERDVALVREQDAALGIDRRHASLGDEMNALPIEAKVVLRLEEGEGFLVVDHGGHQIPGHSTPVDPRGEEQLFGKDLEKRFPQDGAHPKASLGPIESEPGSLSAGYGEGGDASTAEGGFPLEEGLPPLAGMGRVL